MCKRITAHVAHRSTSPQQAFSYGKKGSWHGWSDQTPFQAGLHWSIGQSVFLAFTLIVSTVIMASIDLATHCSLFWNPASGGRIPYIAEYFVEFAKYPITLYDQMIRTVITWILPFAFVSNFPALILLGKVDSNVWIAYLSPIVGLLAILLAALLWRRGLAQYQSAGN